MTEPGYVAPPAPGWWVRTNRVGTTTAGHEWDFAVVGASHKAGAAAGAYTWAGAAEGRVNITVGTPTTSSASTITLPTHAVGDLIVIYAFVDAPFGIDQPVAGGTVPTWTAIDGSAATSWRTSYTVATATNHTSGTWTNANRMIAVVLKDQHTTPIGGHAIDQSTGTTATAPAVTMTNTDASSVLLHFHGSASVSGGVWASAPAGYTRLAELVTFGIGVCLNKKTDTTSDGAVSQGTTANTTWRCATVEIRAH